jgi:hypothetical protein
VSEQRETLSETQQKLESGAYHGSQSIIEDAAMSAAISLKRIADTQEEMLRLMGTVISGGYLDVKRTEG